MFHKYVLKLVLLLPLHITKIIQTAHYWEYLPMTVWRVHVTKFALTTLPQIIPMKYPLVACKNVLLLFNLAGIQLKTV